MNIFIIPIFVILLDQITKIYVKYNFSLYENFDLLGEYIRIFYIENSGIAFGIDTSKYHFFITLLTIIAIFIILYYFFTVIKEDKLEKYPISFILGGAIGNCIDRILVLFPNSGYNGVVDFIDIGFGSFRWYIFNIADSSITCGVLFYLFIFYKNQYTLNDKGNSK